MFFIHFALLLSLTACCCSTDPRCSFSDVQCEVAARTGETIVWNRECFTEEVETLLSHPLTVERVVHVALVNNRSLQATYERLGIAQADLVQAGLLENPVFDLSLKYHKKFGGADKIIDMGLLQNVLDILLKPLKVKFARAELEKTKLEIAGEVLDLITETKKAFYSYQIAEKTYQMMRDVSEATAAAYEVASRLQAAGNITHHVLIEHQMEAEKSRLELATAELHVHESRERLNLLMGLYDSLLNWKVSLSLDEISDDKIDFFRIEECAVAHSLDLAIARQKIRTAAVESGIHITEHLFPELGLGVDSERDSSGEWFVGPKIAVALPLFDFGQAGCAAAKAELLKLWNEYYALGVKVRAKARLAAFHLLTAQMKGRTAMKSLIPWSEQITQQTLKQYNAMQIGVFELLRTKIKEIETKKDAYTAYREYWIANADLEHVLSGRIEE